ncbi:phosphotransferase family protein [Natrinema sp. 1APR25-10V2]|uniref:phosphotransferase family protein n=1 Tax=Natrinema sp. 1APR25-10V2 TaxID=2951081 RepID=UPI002876CA19|nr:phosphotransferase family protein [Natrinema sp. 1APR25-10V2]MDS0473726.1 phosphotransferase family protein [Natrinema sp. 1APR25-10V2]
MANGQSEEAYLEQLIDEESLREYLASELGAVDEFAVTYHQAGHSNETLFVDWGERELVCRRPPAGATADSAHDVLREYRVMNALQGTDVPLPETVLECDDHDVIGSDFYVMERLRGDVIREAEPKRFGKPEFRRRIGTELVDVGAEIHALDPEAVGLGSLGHPDGYTERQVDRWTAQIEWAMEVTSERREVPTLFEVADWLADNVPEPPANTLVHGDFKLDNVLFEPGTPPEIGGVFDWEMCTRGNPFVDLGWMLAYWPDEKDPERTKALTPSFLAHADYPTRRQLLERYEDRTGWTFENQRFYRAFGVFKIASASEMFFRRYLEGNSNDPTYPNMEERVPEYAAWAERIIDGEEPL